MNSMRRFIVLRSVGHVNRDTAGAHSRAKSFQRLTWTGLLLSAWTLSVAAAAAGEPAHPTTEVRTKTQVLTGKLVASDQSGICLVDRYGRLEILTASTIVSQRIINQRFRFAGTSDFRTHLRTETSKASEIRVGNRYIVCGVPGKTDAYHHLLQTAYREVERYFRVHGFDTHEPESLLVAIVFSSSKEFAEYCRKDGVDWSPGLRGYYSQKSNRIALYDEATSARTSQIDKGVSNKEADLFRSPFRVPEISSDHRSHFAASVGSLHAATAATLIHEATHQIAHNIGIHSRMSPTPTWVIEGLATVLEAPGMRKSSPQSTLRSRVNQERLDWFREKLAPRRQIGDLAGMIASDELFKTRTLDAYSQAWAITYFLTESPLRARQFVAYLKKAQAGMSERPHTAEQRLKDFQSVFGDVARLDVEFARFMEDISNTSAGSVAAND